MVGGHYKGQIYGMRTSYNGSYSPGSVSGAELVWTDAKEIRDRVHTLNESMQRPLRRRAGGIWSYMSGTREIRSNRCSLWSSG